MHFHRTCSVLVLSGGDFGVGGTQGTFLGRDQGR